MKKIYQKQQGIALFVVIVLVMLSMLLALWASRTSLFNEILISNDADYQRAFEAAQSMLQDAELDISEKSSSGEFCKPSTTDANICRDRINIKFPEEEKDLNDLLTAVNVSSKCIDNYCPKCLSAICQKRASNQDFWNEPKLLQAMLAEGVGARYGTYTGAQKNEYINPILTKTDSKEGAWYWIEVMSYDINPSSLMISSESNGAIKKWELNLKPPIVYRITAMARGLKPGTQVVLQSTFARQKLKD